MKSQIVNSSRKLLLDIDLPKRVNVAKSGANEAALLTICGETIPYFAIAFEDRIQKSM